jgi:hypothetical protein
VRCVATHGSQSFAVLLLLRRNWHRSLLDSPGLRLLIIRHDRSSLPSQVSKLLVLVTFESRRGNVFLIFHVYASRHWAMLLAAAGCSLRQSLFQGRFGLIIAGSPRPGFHSRVRFRLTRLLVTLYTGLPTTRELPTRLSREWRCIVVDMASRSIIVGLSRRRSRLMRNMCFPSVIVNRYGFS